MEVINEPIVAMTEAGTLKMKVTEKTLICKKPECGGYCGSKHQRC